MDTTLSAIELRNKLKNIGCGIAFKDGFGCIHPINSVEVLTDGKTGMEILAILS